MTKRSELWRQVKETAIRTGEPLPRYRGATNEFMTNWLANFNEIKEEDNNTQITDQYVEDKISSGDFTELFQRITEPGVVYTNDQASSILTALTSNQDYKYTVNVDGTIFTITLNTLEQLHEILTTGYEERQRYQIRGSDTITQAITQGFQNIVVTPIERTLVNNPQSGAFFRFLNNTKIDLKRYQIFNKSTKSENCLIHTLRNITVYDNVTNAESKIDNALLSNIKYSCPTGNISKKDLYKIAEILQTDILVKRYDSKYKKERSFLYCKKVKLDNASKKSNVSYGRHITIALYEDHYFIYEKTKYCQYAIRNYELVKDKADWFKYIAKNKKKRSIDAILNSLDLVVLMMKCGYFKKGDMSNIPEASQNTYIKNDIYLDNIDSEQRETVIKEREKQDNLIWFADSETFVNKQGEKHELYMLGYMKSTAELVSRILNVCDYKHPQDLINDFLKDVTNNGRSNSIVFFHNLKYDITISEKYLHITSICEKDNQIYSYTALYKGKLIEFRDSYKIAPMKLEDFHGNFNLAAKYHKLEAINYGYYTRKNNNLMIPTSEYEKGMSEKNIKIFRENMAGKTVFNPTEYYKTYLKMDCAVLRMGILKFESIIKEKIDDKLSVFDSLTISSLTDKYMKLNGAYKDIYEMCGNLRKYCSLAIYGGRVHCNTQFKKQVIEEKLSDYDACSLYPSAINRLCRERGLPKGKAKWIPNKEFYSEGKYDYAIFTVKITRINKIQQMPMIAIKSDKSTDYVNEITEDKIVVIDSYTLEDYIKFHDIEYEILDGVFWDGGYNKTMGTLINKLYTLRLANKETNPALANILKLMLNSAYGKTIIKPARSNIKVINFNKDKDASESTLNDKINKHIDKYYGLIKTIRVINNYSAVVHMTETDSSFNRSHIGVSILSYSKKIMNEVFDICNDNKYPIYYTDTDSIHLKYDHVPLLEQKYKELYNKELNGKNMEQFHSDFQIDNVKGYDIYAMKSIFLGKKSYIDILEGVKVIKDEDGNIINKDVIHSTHLRLKGITDISIQHHTNNDYNGDSFRMFEDLAKGVSKNMTLNPPNPEKKVLFQYISGSVIHRKTGSFKRLIKF